MRNFHTISPDTGLISITITSHRADAVRHNQGHQDPVPQPSDIMDPEEYVSRATVSKTSSNYAPSSCVQPQKLTREEFCQFSKTVMDLL